MAAGCRSRLHVLKTASGVGGGRLGVPPPPPSRQLHVHATAALSPLCTIVHRCLRCGVGLLATAYRLNGEPDKALPLAEEAFAMARRMWSPGYARGDQSCP
jgi:hypothetical protein